MNLRFNKKITIAFLVFAIVVSLGMMMLIVNANPIISGTGVDHSAQVEVDFWGIYNQNNVQVSSTVGVSGSIPSASDGNAQRHRLMFTWTLTPNTPVVGGDYIIFPMPEMATGVWRPIATVPPVSFFNENDEEIGQWQLIRGANAAADRIVVVFNENIGAAGQIDGVIGTSTNALHATGGGNWGLTQYVTFGGSSQYISFPARTPLQRAPGSAGGSSRKTAGTAPQNPANSVNWQIHVGEDAYAHLRLSRGQSFIPQQGVLIIDELAYRMVPGSFGIQSRWSWTYTLEPGPNAGRRTNANSGTAITSHFEQIPHNGESFEDFLALVQANQLQWGVYEGANSDTIVVWIGDVNTATSRDPRPQYFGQPMTRSLISPNWASQRANANLSFDPPINATYQELFDFYTDTFGDGNVVGGHLQQYRFAFDEQLPAHYAGATVTNTARVYSSRYEGPDDTGFRLRPSGANRVPFAAGESITPLQAERGRVFLRDFHNNFNLIGATFALEVYDSVNSTWSLSSFGFIHANGAINNLGYLDTVSLANGTYRFVQLTAGNHPGPWNLPGSNVGTGGVDGTGRPVSNPFTITAGGAGQQVEMTNIRVLRNVSFVAGSNGAISPYGSDANLTVAHGNTLVASQTIPTPTGNTNYQFSHWTSNQHQGEFTSDVSLRGLAITADTVFEAHFEAIMYTVTFYPGANGVFANYVTYIAIQVQRGTVLQQSNVPAVTANNGWAHTGWNSPSNPVGFTVTGDVSFTATYTELVEVTFRRGANGVFADGNYEYITISVPIGTILTEADIPEITANQGWNHTGWDVNPVDFEVTEDVEFVATYERVRSPQTGISGFAIGAIALVTLGGVMFVFVKKADKATV